MIRYDTRTIHMTLLLLSYNNYFNRIIKRDTLEGYLTYKCKYVQNYAFQYRDGVNTDITITWKEDFTPDYCVVLKDNGSIDSRWFLTDAKYINGSQFFSTLKRDLVADYYEDVIHAPAFIEKGYVDANSPLIFNKEDFACNQIKVDEKLLYDGSKCSWIVFYYDTKSDSKSKMKTTNDNKIKIEAENYEDLSAYYETLEDWPIWQRYHNGYKTPISKQYQFYFRANHTSLREGEYVRYINKPNFDGSIPKGYCQLSGNNLYDSSLDWQSYTNPFQSRDEDTRRALVGGAVVFDTVLKNTTNIQSLTNSAFIPADSINTLINNWDNKVVKFADNRFYRVSFHHITTTTTPVYEQEAINNINTPQLWTNIVSKFDDIGWGIVTDENGTEIGFFEKSHGATTADELRHALYMLMQFDRYQVVFQEVETGQQMFTMDMTGCQDIFDQPYGIGCIPFQRYDNEQIQIDDYLYLPDGLPMAIMNWLITKSGAKIYDVQILPYCPFSIYYTQVLSTYQLSSAERTYVYYDDAPNVKAGFILHPRSSKFTKNIAVGINVNDSEKKIANQCTMHRLVSPNYSGQFEFNIAKNGCSVNYVNIDCTYKPYAPYIHVNPDFKGLYGQDFDDARGLICGGDFSSTIMNDEWNEYKIQNKNFNDIFNRQIENMDVSRSLSRDKEIAGMFTGVGKGIVGGAIAGGNPATVLTGAGAGLISSGVNYYTNEKQYQENRDYTIDIHNYQLDNIKALPTSLAKVDAYNNNNKMFPFLEEYSCTDEEKEIFRQKLKYEGMTVNARGTIYDYLNPNDTTFIKGQLTRLPDIKDDSHIAYAIYEEINKGVYL